jgi:hypothetical protein
VGLDVGEGQFGTLNESDGLAFGVVSVGGETETYLPFIYFRGIVKELGEAGEPAEYEWKDSGSHGVQGSQVTDAALAGDAADTIDYIVRSESYGLVQN